MNEAIKAFNDSESIVYESGSGLFDDLKNSSELKVQNFSSGIARNSTFYIGSIFKINFCKILIDGYVIYNYIYFFKHNMLTVH